MDPPMTKRKPGAPKGNKHAQKGDTPLDARLSVRLPHDVRRAIERKAAQSGLKAGTWAAQVLAQEALK